MSSSEPRPVDAYVLVPILYSLGCIGNFVLLVTLVWKRPLKVKLGARLLAVQLCVDGAVSGLGVHFSLHRIRPWPLSVAAAENYIANLLYCVLYYSMGFYWWLILVSSYNLVCIALDQFMAVVRASVYRSSQRVLKIVAVLLDGPFTALVASPLFMQLTYSTHLGTCIYSQLSVIVNRLLPVAFGIALGLIPCSVFLFCYSSLGYILLKQRRFRRVSPSTGHSSSSTTTGQSQNHNQSASNAMNNAPFKQFLVAMLLSSLMFTVSLSYATVFSILQFYEVLVMSDEAQTLTYLTPSLNNAVRPFVLVLAMKSLRRSLLSCFEKKHHNSSVVIRLQPPTSVSPGP